MTDMRYGILTYQNHVKNKICLCRHVDIHHNYATSVEKRIKNHENLKTTLIKRKVKVLTATRGSG